MKPCKTTTCELSEIKRYKDLRKVQGELRSVRFQMDKDRDSYPRWFLYLKEIKKTKSVFAPEKTDMLY